MPEETKDQQEQKKPATEVQDPIAPVEPVKPVAKKEVKDKPVAPAAHKDKKATPVTKTKAPNVEEAPEEEEVEEVSHPEFSYEGKVKLSHREFDAVDKKTVTKHVKASGIRDNDKEIILAEIKNDCVTPQNGEVIKAIIDADAQGSVYSGHNS